MSAASLLNASQIAPGKPLPPLPSPESVSLAGKNIIIGVPEASDAQISEYIDEYEGIKAKGIEGIYVVAVNDQSVVSGWKEKLAPNGTRMYLLEYSQRV